MSPARATRLLALFAGVLLAVPARADDPSAWTEVAPKGGGFAIRLPGIPTQETDRETKARQLEIRSGDRRYYVSFRDLTPDERKADPAATLEKSRDAFMQAQAGAVLRDSEKTPLGASPGLLWTFDTQAVNAPPIRIRGRMILAKNRLYTLIYADRKFAFDDAAPGSWFETFRLTR